MSTPRTPKPAKLIVGCFMKDRSLFPQVSEILEGTFNAPDLVSPWIPFDYTSYYEKEMGVPLYRRMLAFKNLIEQSRLPDIKLYTNGIERSLERDGARRVNIDPGYLTHERLVLATGKNYTHRIYLGKGIFADLTLIYTRGAFKTLPWTYPDYADQRMLTFLEKVRQKYVLDAKKIENPKKDGAFE